MVHTDDSVLQRSPSLMSRSSGASTPPPTTPSLSSSSTLSSSASTFPSSSLSIDEHGNKVVHRQFPNNAAIPRSNTARAYLSGTLNGQHAPLPTNATHEKGMFAYQSKYLSRTASIQSLSSVTSPPASHSNLASLPRLPTIQNVSRHSPSSSFDTGSTSAGSGSTTSRAQKRTTWAPGHRLPGSGSVSSVDDIMGRFGGGNGASSVNKLPSSATSHHLSGNTTPRSGTPTFPTSTSSSYGSSYGAPRPHSPVKSSYGTPPLSASALSSTSQAKADSNHSINSSATSWKSSLARTSTQKSDSENVAPFPSSQSSANSANTSASNASSYSGTLPSSRRFNSTPSSPTSYASPHGSSNSRPLSPTSHSSVSNLRNTFASPPPTSTSTPLESEIMRSSVSNGANLGHRPKQSSFHLGSVNDLGHSSVGMLRNFREYAVQEGSGASSSGRDSPSSSATLSRKFTVSGGGGSSSASRQSHRRTQTLPSLGDVGALVSSSPSSSSTSDRPSRERHNSSGAADGLEPHSYVSSRYAGPNGTKLNMHGLDRLSERSDTSLNDDDASASLGLGRPDGTPTSSRNRRMASDAGENETGAIVIPGITVGSDNVAGLSGRLRLARQPTQTKYGTLPSVTVKAMESQRQCLQAYEYLCHVSEAKEWLVACLWNHPLSPSMTQNSPEVNLASPASIGGNSPMIGAGDEEDPSGLSNKSVVELEEALRNGVALARLARAFMGEKAVPRIFTVSNAFHAREWEVCSVSS